MFMYVKMRDIEVACMSQLTKETRYKKHQHANVLGKCKAKNHQKVYLQKIESDTNCNFSNNLMK